MDDQNKHIGSAFREPSRSQPLSSSVYSSPSSLLNNNRLLYPRMFSYINNQLPQTLPDLRLPHPGSFLDHMTQFSSSGRTRIHHHADDMQRYEKLRLDCSPYVLNKSLPSRTHLKIETPWLHLGE